MVYSGENKNSCNYKNVGLNWQDSNLGSSNGKLNLNNLVIL